MFKKPKLLNEFIQICKSTGYFDAVATENKLKNIQFLSFAQILQKKIEHEWKFRGKGSDKNLKTYYDNDFPELENNATIFDKYLAVRKQLKVRKLAPFGISEITKKDIGTQLYGREDKEIQIELTGSESLLNLSYFVNDKESQEYFYRVQRERKLWWMKYAANPGRFSISEMTTEEGENCSKDTVFIHASYPFGKLAVETVDLMKNVPKTALGKTLKIKEKSGSPNNIIKTSTYLELATIELCIDAIDAGDFGEICLHRKIAPYQCYIYCLASDPKAINDLKDLVRYITLILEKANISILNLENCAFSTKDELDREYAKMDSVGVPYGITLEEQTLQNGLMKLRNRDTTLCENIHISYIPDYLMKIFNS